MRETIRYAIGSYIAERLGRDIAELGYGTGILVSPKTKEQLGEITFYEGRELTGYPVMTISRGEVTVWQPTQGSFLASLESAYTGMIGSRCRVGIVMDQLRQVAREVIRSGPWRTHIIDMTDNAEDGGMVCGGEMRVLIERI